MLLIEGVRIQWCQISIVLSFRCHLRDYWIALTVTMRQVVKCIGRESISITLLTRRDISCLYLNLLTFFCHIWNAIRPMPTSLCNIDIKWQALHTFMNIHYQIWIFDFFTLSVKAQLIECYISRCNYLPIWNNFQRTALFNLHTVVQSLQLIYSIGYLQLISYCTWLDDYLENLRLVTDDLRCSRC